MKKIGITQSSQSSFSITESEIGPLLEAHLSELPYGNTAHTLK